MRFLAGLLAAAAIAPAALADTYPLTGENTKIEFTGTKKDGKHDGGFKDVNGAATATGNDPTTIGLQVIIQMDSLYSDNEKLTGHLKAPDFFDVKTNPIAKFAATKVEKLPDAKSIYKVSGPLTLNGKTREISVPAVITLGEKLTLNSEFKINRQDFGMTYGSGKVDDIVAIRVKVDAKKE